MKRSIFLISFLSMKSSGRKSRTSPAIRVGKSLASKRVIGPTPERPSTTACQFLSTPVPSGVTKPTPVTATRRRCELPFCIAPSIAGDGRDSFPRSQRDDSARHGSRQWPRCDTGSDGKGSPMGKLDGKIAVITGGAGGIGIAAGKRFASEGARALLVDLDEAALRRAVAEVGEKSASFVVADVSRPEDVQRYVRTCVERYGGIDV